MTDEDIEEIDKQIEEEAPTAEELAAQQEQGVMK
jgi:hypothetical protein